MKIQVKGDGHNLTIPVPTNWLFSKPSAWLWLKMAKMTSIGAKKHIDLGDDADKYFSKIPDKAVYAICDELRRTKKKYGNWTLVEVKSSSGEEVTISL